MGIQLFAFKGHILKQMKIALDYKQHSPLVEAQETTASQDYNEAG